MNEQSSPLVAQVVSRLDEFTEDELLHLNRLIVERLRLMRQIGAHHTMTKFRIGQRIRFETPAGRVVKGTLTRYNRKTVTVVADDGGHWNVDPGLLRSDAG